MYPFDLAGPDFLNFYCTYFASAVTLGLLARWVLRSPGGNPVESALDLNPYEIAYLNGGASHAVNVAMASLISQKVLVPAGTEERIKRATPLSRGAHELERECFLHTDPARGSTLESVREPVAQHASLIGDRLADQGLVLAEPAHTAACSLPAAMAGSATILGVIKVLIGLGRGRPVLALVGLCALSIVVVLGLSSEFLRSRRGDRALEMLRERYAALGVSATSPDKLTPKDLTLALAVFGMGILANATGLLGDLRTKPESTSWNVGGWVAFLGDGDGDFGGGCGGGGGCGSCGGCGS